MKKLIHIALGLALVFGMSSCEDYLDVNTDPDNPVSETVSPQLRLPWIQNYYAYAWGTASMRTNTIAGIMTQTGGTAANSLLSSWNPAQSSCTTIYQNFYLGAGVNIDPLIEKAETEGAYTNLLAFRNPDNSIALIIANETSDDHSLSIRIGDRVYTPIVKAYSMNTLLVD